MAILDQAPRLADAAVLEDATLLKVSQEDFFEVMSGHPQIMHAIIRLLTGRLREANAKLAEKR
jgi:CRP-like cAMP-binding protein